MKDEWEQSMSHTKSEKHKHEDFTEGPVMRLAGKWKSGIFSLIFSRFTLIVIMFIIQIIFMLALWGFFGDLFGHVYKVLRPAFVAVILLVLVNSDMDSSAKITWMLVGAVVPLFTALFYVWTRTEVGHRKIGKRMNEITELLRPEMAQDPETFKRLKATARDTSSVAGYTMKVGDFPAYDGSKVTYFPLGEDKFPVMLEKLESAEKYIFLEYFIIQEGYMWGRILDILKRKADAGVEVRVMFDGTCLLGKVPADYQERLQRIGIQCKVWEPLTPVITSTYNYRDHRKVLVVDGKVAFNGGVNLADEYINKTHPFGHWKDTAVMVEGKAVRSYIKMFLEMWNAADEGLEENWGRYLDERPEPVTGAQGFVIPYADSPLDDYKVGEMVYIDVLNTAEDYVYITTPYLILDGELTSALKFAAERGVDVRIIMPGIPDKKMVYALSRSYYRTLLKSGVRIYEYTPGFVHAKVFVSDDRKAIVGTINLDYRSLYHHFECATYMVDVPCVSEIKQDYLMTLNACREVTEEVYHSWNGLEQLLGAVIRIFAPML